MLADATRLPFRTGTFDLIFTGPPWDHLDVLGDAKPELERVLRPDGLMVLLLPYLQDRKKATMVVTDRHWTRSDLTVVPAPRVRRGPRYFSPADDFVRRVIARHNPRRLLDPFCGVGTIPRIASAMGVDAHGCDIDAEAVFA